MSKADILFSVANWDIFPFTACREPSIMLTISTHLLSLGCIHHHNFGVTLSHLFTQFDIPDNFRLVLNSLEEKFSL